MSRQIRLWLYDHGATWAMRIGDAISGPWSRLERHLTDKWFALRPYD